MSVMFAPHCCFCLLGRCWLQSAKPISQNQSRMTQPSQPETTSSIAIQPPTWVWDTANADDQPDEDDDLDDWCTSQALKQIIAAEQAGFAAIAAAQEQLQCMGCLVNVSRCIITLCTLHAVSPPNLGTPPPDLEDFGTIKDRLAQPKHATLTVTQLAACEVCQQQLAYRWSTDRPEVCCACYALFCCVLHSRIRPVAAPPCAALVAALVLCTRPV